MANRRSSLHELLLGDHRRVSELLARVAERVDANDIHGALAEWPELERSLLAHMNAEEMHILSRLAEDDSAEAARLVAEHAAIRAELGELGLALELHTARKSAFDALLARLQAHAEREENLMYRWADKRLPEQVAGAVRRFLNRRWWTARTVSAALVSPDAAPPDGAHGAREGEQP